MISFKLRGFMKDYDQFEKWCSAWEKASKQEAFQSPPIPEEMNFGNVNSGSFFGVITENKDVDMKSIDSKYWLNLLNLQTRYKNDPNVINDYLEGKLTTEEINMPVKDFTNAVTTAANPIKPNSVGMDQDPNNLVSISATYTNEDLAKLEKLKNELYELLLKLNQSELEGETSKKMKDKLEDLQKDIDELSDKMTKTLPQQS